jgi:HSP20 family molecular chaperone IbpA
MDRKIIDNVKTNVKNIADTVKNSFKDIKKSETHENFKQIKTILIEDENAIYLFALLPGVDKEEIKVTRIGNNLNISIDPINIKQNIEKLLNNAKTIYLNEFTLNQQYKTITLPCKIQDKIESIFENGILELIFYKVEEEKYEIKL